MGLAVGELGEDAVEVGAGEGPLERLGDLAVVLAEGRQALGERVETSRCRGVSALRCRLEKSCSGLAEPRPR